MATWVICLCVAANVACAEAPGEVGIGQRLPDAVMDGLNGPNRNLRDFSGKPLIINVWASWCGPCRAEMVSLERLAWRDDSAYFTIIGISTDDYRERANAALRSGNATLSHFIDSQLQLETLLGASRLPLTVLVSRDGRVIQKIYGARDWDSPQSLQLIKVAFGPPG